MVPYRPKQQINVKLPFKVDCEDTYQTIDNGRFRKRGEN